VREELQGWRQDISKPVQLDVWLNTGGSGPMREFVGASESEPTIVLLERWRMQYVPCAEPLGQCAWDPSRFYKRFCVLIRSIVAQLRLLPAQRLAMSLSKLRGGALLGYTLRLSDNGGQVGIAGLRPHPVASFLGTAMGVALLRC
jgi:hypothetical protein